MLTNPIDQASGRGKCRYDAGAVAGVDPGLLDVLHDRAYIYLFAVADRVHVDLDGVLKKFVQQDGVFG